MTIGQGLVTILILGVLLMCLLVKIFPENPRKVKRVKIYYRRDNIGRFTAASRSKRITYVGGNHGFTTNIGGIK